MKKFVLAILTYACAVSAEPTQDFLPYFSGGVVGNGGDELRLVPEKKSGSEDAVVAVPQFIKQYGYIRVDGKEYDGRLASYMDSSGSYRTFKLLKCNGTVTADGYFRGRNGACVPDAYGATGAEYSLDLNVSTRVAPGYYLLKTTVSGTSMNRTSREIEFSGNTSDVFFPGVIRIEKGKTTIVPLPKIILPEISGEVYVTAKLDLSNKGVVSNTIFSAWMTDDSYRSACKGQAYKRSTSFWESDSDSSEEKQASCRYLSDSNWKKVIPRWKTKTWKDSKDVTRDVGARILGLTYDYYKGTYDSVTYWSSMVNVNPHIPTGKHINVFPGVYELRFESYSGMDEYQENVVVGGFNSQMVGKVFPSK